MKINTTLNMAAKPLRIFDSVSNGKTQLASKNDGGWSQMWGKPLANHPVTYDITEGDIYGLFEFDMVYGGFEDMTLEEQIETKFNEFWYNASDDRYFKQFLYPLLEANPNLKKLVAKEAKATALLPKVTPRNPQGRLKVRDPISDKFASKVWKMRKKDSIVDAVFDALTSQRAIKNLPAVTESAKGFATLQVAMKLENGSKPSFAGVTVHSANAKGKEIKQVLKDNGVGFYRAFIVPHLSIFQNRMAEIHPQYNVYAASGGIALPEEIMAMFRTASAETPLREKVIRLAHQKPELREHLLPLVKEAKRVNQSKKTASSEKGKVLRTLQQAANAIDTAELQLEHISQHVSDDDHDSYFRGGLLDSSITMGLSSLKVDLHRLMADIKRSK